MSDHRPVQSVLRHDTPSSPRLFSFSPFCTSILKPHLKDNNKNTSIKALTDYLLNNQGAVELVLGPSSADSTMQLGNGKLCLTIAPYKPYSAIMLPFPHLFSVFLHFALLF